MKLKRMTQTQFNICNVGCWTHPSVDDAKFADNTQSKLLGMKTMTKLVQAWLTPQ